MKSKLWRALGTAAMVALALVIGLASVSVFTGTDVLQAAKDSLTGVTPEHAAESEAANAGGGLGGFTNQLRAVFEDEESIAKLRERLEALPLESQNNDAITDSADVTAIPHPPAVSNDAATNLND